MDRKNNSRTSFSSSPIAESTHLNKSYKFPWGGKFSPTQRYLAANNTSIKSNSKLMENATIKSTKMSPVNITKIDPRVYTDIHSKGLTSRIVKYHDDSIKLNRSLSASSLYNKPGQFPIVHLNKSQIQYKANRNRPASIVRIAPPDKAVFQANTRSSILRTPSIVPTVSLRKTNTELSCENRPILHPVDSNDPVPTRSVLDALREISRKRINSDDLDGNDVIKKYCKETEDISRSIASNSILSNSFAMKRQRDIQLSPNSQLINSACEQAIKKRMYTRNNDISSSLSSSLHIMTPKRKLADIQSGHSISPTAILLSSSSENSISPKAKQPCNERHNQQQQLLSDKSSVNNLQTPTSCAVKQITPVSLPVTTVPNEHSAKTHLISSGNAASVVAVQTSSNENTSQKPKLTLFNKNYDDEDFKRKLDSRKLSREREEYGMRFVKPRNTTYTQLEKNPMIERMKQSRLALMLKGLRGELNENGEDASDNSEDETDNSLKANRTINQLENSEKSDTIESNPVIGSAVTTSASMSFATNTTVSTSTISSPAIAVNPKTSQEDEKEFLSVGKSSNVSLDIGLKKNIVSITAAITTVSSSVLPSIGTTAATNSMTVKPTGEFSFGINKEQKSITVSTEASKIMITKSNTNLTTTVSSINNPTVGGFTFGEPKFVSSSNRISGSATAAFSFPSKSSTDNVSNLTPQSSQGGFNFGNQEITIPMTQSKSAFVPVSNVSKSTDQKVEVSQTLTTQTSIFGAPTNSTAVFSNFPSNMQTTSGTTSFANQTSPITFGPTSSNTLSGLSSSPKSSPFSSFTNNPQPSVAVTSAPSIFGSNTQEKPIVSFTSPQSSAVNNASPFGDASKSSVSTNFTEASKTNNLLGNQSSAGFTFGNVKNASQEKSTAAPFAFGSSSSAGGFSFKNPTAPATTTTPSTGAISQFSFAGAGNQIGASPFNLGNSSSANQFHAPSSNVGFNFATPSKATDTVKPFSFNTSNQTQTTSSSTTSTPVFSFGGNATNSTENKQASFAFGNPNTAATSTASSGFAFNNTNSQNQNTFGNPATNKNPIGGFSFNSPPSGENKFSGFGTFSVTTTAQQTQPSQLSSSKFSFTGISNKNEVKPSDSSSSIFAAPPANNAQNVSFGASSIGQVKSFNFSSTPTNTNSQNLFGGVSAPATTTSSIFGSVGSELGKPAPAFSFGGASANQQATSNTSFALGASSNNTNQMNNPFGSNPTLNKAPAFSFGAQANATPNTATNISPSPNIFLGPSGGSTTDRPIRKATRRLKNS